MLFEMQNLGGVLADWCALQVGDRLGRMTSVLFTLKFGLKDRGCVCATSWVLVRDEKLLDS